MRALLIFLFSSTVWAVEPKNVVIYFVIDDSASMNSYQQNLQQTAEAFVSGLAAKGCAKYKIAFHYISKYELKQTLLAPNPTYITNETPNALALIGQRMTPRATPAAHERVLDGLVQIINNEASLLREQDFVAAIILSDAAPTLDKNTSDSALESITRIVPANKFAAFALGIDFSKPTSCPIDTNECEEEIRPPITGEALRICAEKRGLATPYLLHEFTAKTHGIHANLCQRDYQQDMSRILNSILEKAQCAEPSMM